MLEKIEIITRIQDDELYARMKKSAEEEAFGPVSFSSEKDKDGLPHLADTYNRLGGRSDVDFIVFCHDDAVFMEPGWNEKLIDEFKETGADILGVVGTDKYIGGNIFLSGNPNCFGKYATLRQDGKNYVQIASPSRKNKRLQVVDGLFLAVRGDHFKSVKFDESFDELWFYAEDFCLRSNVFLSDILMGHWKPPRLYGKYPDALKPQSDYAERFYTRYGIAPPEEGAWRPKTKCAETPIEDFRRFGQDFIFEKFAQSKGLVHA